MMDRYGNGIKNKILASSTMSQNKIQICSIIQINRHIFLMKQNSPLENQESKMAAVYCVDNLCDPLIYALPSIRQSENTEPVVTSSAKMYALPGED